MLETRPHVQTKNKCVFSYVSDVMCKNEIFTDRLLLADNHTIICMEIEPY